ncbi:MAG: polyprenol monophosphomannose synthase [bacterium]
MRALVIIPTYNERENIETVVSKVLEAVDSVHVLIVDDNSPDGTGEIADELSRRDSRVHVMRRPGKLGLGTAYIEGFKYALANGYEYIFEMDADLSHDPSYLPLFLEKIEGCDLVLGSRYISGGGVRNWGPIRRIVSRGGSLYSRIILGLPFRDLTGGFKCFRREVLQRINLDAVRSNGYSFQIEMTYRAYKEGFRIEEIPIIFVDRRAGRSKMSRKIFWEAVIMVWKLRLGLYRR